MKWVYLLIAIVAEVVGTSALRASQGFTVLLASVIVLLGYLVAFYFLSLTLDASPSASRMRCGPVSGSCSSPRSAGCGSVRHWTRGR